jgi:hypothetical protein
MRLIDGGLQHGLKIGIWYAKSEFCQALIPTLPDALAQFGQFHPIWAPPPIGLPPQFWLFYGGFFRRMNVSNPNAAI